MYKDAKAYNSVYRMAAVAFDTAYRLWSPMKPCSLLLEHETFDEQHYTPDTFFDHVQHYFDNPAAFYRKSFPDLAPGIQRLLKPIYADAPMFAFQSPVLSGWEHNDRACFHHFSADQPADTILLFAPGWGRANLDAETAVCRQLLKSGIDSCLLVKPFHQQRTPPGFASGELFISGNVFLTVKNFRQFVSEIIFLVDHFKKSYKRVGLVGMSSGGFQCGLAANAVEVDYYFPVITGAGLGNITWEGKLSQHVKRQIMQKGITVEELGKAWAISDQHYLAHTCKAKHIKQFISLYDQVIPSRYQWKLWELYNRPEKSLLHCAHAGIFLQLKRITREIASFIHDHP